MENGPVVNEGRNFYSVNTIYTSQYVSLNVTQDLQSFQMVVYGDASKFLKVLDLLKIL